MGGEMSERKQIVVFLFPFFFSSFVSLPSTYFSFHQTRESSNMEAAKWKRKLPRTLLIEKL
jgi:hypothetical protein